jgi:ribosome-binding protein aMBF1 (putative translation factor)
MPKKVALLIGVSQYDAGLPPLVAAPNDVEAMRRVLLDPNIGGFDEVNPLIDPDPVTMQIAIGKLLRGCKREDLALLFFSGHGITNDDGRLYLTTRITDEAAFKETSVPASFVHDVMNDSRCKRQVVILDCCYSGAFAAGWQPKSGGAVDIKRELGGEGRAILTSSTALQKSFEHEGSGIYTRFLVEGLETGAADTDGTGTISILELHDYAKEKVQAAKPAMKPEIYSHKEGFNIILTRSPVNDPELEYRREVETWVKKRRGEISGIGRRALNRLATKLKLSSEVTKRIEAEVLAPYEEHKANLKEYEEVLIEALEQESPLSEVTREELKDLQQVLGLTDEDVARIETSILSEKEAERQPQQSQIPTFSQEDNPKSPIPNLKSDDLSSEKNVDYTRLRNLLADGKWKEADEETLTVMLKAAGREQESYLNIESIETFPCAELRTIDRLWVKYSDGRFGFSVQKRIWESVGGKPGEYDEEIYCKFGERVGWRKQMEWINYSSISFSLNAPPGHLPIVGEVWVVGWGGGWRGGYTEVVRLVLFSRVETCKV